MKPYQPPGYWVFLNFPKRDWTADKGPTSIAAGLYTYWQRTFLHPSLLAFDASTREECVVERPRSNTPLQALVLLERPDLRRIGSGVGRADDSRGGGEAQGPDRARLSTGAFPTAARRRKLPVLLALLQHHYDQYRADPAAAGALLGTGLRA